MHFGTAAGPWGSILSWAVLVLAVQGGSVPVLETDEVQSNIFYRGVEGGSMRVFQAVRSRDALLWEEAVGLAQTRPNYIGLHPHLALVLDGKSLRTFVQAMGTISADTRRFDNDTATIAWVAAVYNRKEDSGIALYHGGQRFKFQKCEELSSEGPGVESDEDMLPIAMKSMIVSNGDGSWELRHCLQPLPPKHRLQWYMVEYTRADGTHPDHDHVLRSFELYDG